MARSRPGRGKPLFLLSLGCAKNLVDSERLAARLESMGYRLVDSVDEARIAIVNTCAFIRPATEESIGAILDLEGLKNEGRLDSIGVVGCLLNRYGNDLKKDLPSVDFWAEAEDWEALGKSLGGPAPSCGNERALLPGTARWSRFLKIAEGCDNHCSYCMIPSIRGRLRSLPLGDLVREARELVSQGAREICLVAQDLTAWGTDLYGNPSLAVLLSELGENLPETTWLRLLYLHPARLDNALLDRILGNARVLPYLDIPIQHASPGVLEAMNREIPPGRMREIFSRIREANPDFALRTTVMVGHPLEDEKAFETLLDFVSEVRFDRLGAFAYSPEEGTVSAALPGKVQARVKKRRLDKLMKLQEEISLARQARFEGKTLRILVESVDRNENLAFGRSYREAPEVDGVVEVRGGGRLIPGTFADVLILEGLEHDMIAEVQHDGV